MTLEELTKHATAIAHAEAKEAATEAYEDIICRYNAEELDVDNAAIKAADDLFDDTYETVYADVYARVYNSAS
jgi:hypothetical protein